jgi:hypothetical protein
VTNQSKYDADRRRPPEPSAAYSQGRVLRNRLRTAIVKKLTEGFRVFVIGSQLQFLHQGGRPINEAKKASAGYSTRSRSNPLRAPIDPGNAAHGSLRAIRRRQAVSKMLNPTHGDRGFESRSLSSGESSKFRSRRENRLRRRG